MATPPQIESLSALFLYPKLQMINELKENDSIDSVFIVKQVLLNLDKNKKPYMNIVLMDRTGELEARIWENTENYVNIVIKGCIVRITGKCKLFQGKLQIGIKSAHLVREDEADLSLLVPPNERDAEALYATLVSMVDSMQDENYQSLARAILIEDESIVELLKRAPAAKSHHHAYETGLLEHIISVNRTLNALAEIHKGKLNRDLLYLGGFFHDIGKLWELDYGKVTDYTVRGNLLGHIVIGIQLINDKIQEIRASGKNFPEDKKLLIEHIVLSHHGKLEYGSPKEPAFLEAQVVHMVDDLDSKINAISEFIRSDINPGPFTVFHKTFNRLFYKTPDHQTKM